jgi:V-type H+-transporting ATPase subunit C
MPSDQSTWLVSIPNDGDDEGVAQELQSKLGSASKASAYLSQIAIPSFKVNSPLYLRQHLRAHLL